MSVDKWISGEKIKNLLELFTIHSIYPLIHKSYPRLIACI